MKRVLLLCAALLAACQKTLPPDPLEDVGDPVPSAGDPVVARVSGNAILASEVRARREARDGGAVLHDLIVEDLLAGEARRQGLLADPQVRSAAHRAMVKRLLTDEFEKSLRPREIPESLLRRAYQKNYWFFNRPEVRHFEHLLVFAGPKDPPEKHAAARRFIGEALEAVRRRPRRLMVEIHGALQPRAKGQGLDLRYEHSNAARSRLEKPFADLLWSLPPGTIAREVVQSRYGWHVVRHVKTDPPVSRPFEEVREEVRERVWPEYRQTKFREWLADLRARYGAKIAEGVQQLFRPPEKP